MKYARLYAGPDGETHLEDAEAEFQQANVVPGNPQIDMSNPLAAQEVVFIRMPAGASMDYHPAPRRHLLVVITGEWNMETSDGSVRRFGPTDVILVEDIDSRGHKTHVTGSDDFLGVFTWLDD